MEARLGCSSTVLEPDKLDQFLKYDRKVLRFYLAWDDRRSLYGELRPFVLHYYLADDTMEVLEVRRANAGRDPFPLFLKRGKVYKDINSYLNIDAPTTHAGLARKRPPPRRPSPAPAPPGPTPLYSSGLTLAGSGRAPPRPRAQLRRPTGPQARALARRLGRAAPAAYLPCPAIGAGTRRS